ncbi:MAG: HAMP domain-containing histidine kinase [Phycisphaerales bacterium]|nr:HAMP domain-containing histidine kinase [Phycisphaerales bacterium]
MSISINMEPNSPQPDNTPTPSSAGSTNRKGRSTPREAVASSEGADRLTVLAHELGNILDGSLRCLGLAERSMPGGAEPEAPGSDEARRRLDTVRQALLRMSELVEAAMKHSAGSLTAEISGIQSPIELGEAIFHAVDVLTPLADEHHVRITACVSNGLSGVPAGPLYPVLVNGLRNAIEAICRSVGTGAEETSGVVDVNAGWTEDGRVRISIRDDGVGLPRAATEAIFQFGFSTKPRGSGLGLAVARSIVEELPEGSIRLFNRADRPATDRPGAILELTFRPVARTDAGAA